MPYTVLFAPLEEEVKLSFRCWVRLLLKPSGIMGISGDWLGDALDGVEELQE